MRHMQILIDASNGASDYGNKFGEPLIAGYTRTFGLRMPSGERREWIKPIMFRHVHPCPALALPYGLFQSLLLCQHSPCCTQIPRKAVREGCLHKQCHLTVKNHDLCSAEATRCCAVAGWAR